MVFNSVSFAVFFPFAVIIYFLIPGEKMNLRKIWLLLCSYYFYISQGVPYLLLLLFSTLMSFVPALIMQKAGKKLCLIISLIAEFSVLIYFKYCGFTGINILLPLGISFYVFKSASYVIDVYRGDMEPEKDLLKYALYIAFFPELSAGPISRAKDMLPQFEKEYSFEYCRIRKGLLRMLTGLFIKLVIASRLSILVDNAYNDVTGSGGMQLLIASLTYSVQIYCDFMSYTEIALGAAEVFGIKSAENFKQPFFAKSLSELWRRWHMSLMSWFKDYLYIPLGGSRKGEIRKYVNILIVFTLSGLWHGAALTYVAWGFLSGLLQCIGGITKKARESLADAFPIHNNLTDFLHKAYMRAATFLLFSFTVVFFRSGSLQEAMLILKKIFTEPGFAGFNITEMGLGTLNLLIALFMVMVLLLIDILKEKKGDIYALITGQKWYVRWGVYFFLSGTILLSANIGAAKFIYFDF